MGDSSNQDKLFLLEFLVDFVCIERTDEMLQGMDNDPCLWNRAQTCVTFQFLDYPPLEITQEDFATKKCAQEGVSLFKNGKSCLFSVSGAALNNCSQFAVDVAVHKKLPPEVLPGQVLVGNSTIQLADIFNEIVNIVKKNPECVPISKTMKNGYFIKNQCGKIVGEIRVFIRLSCFGKLIVTHFELGGGNKPYLFKGNEGNDIYECQKLDSKMDHTSCSSKPRSPAGGQPMMPPPQMMAGGCCRPQFPPMAPQRGFQPYPGAYPPQQPNSGICSPEVCATKDDKDFEEIGAEVNGHALKIRVPKKKKKKDKDNCGPCAPCVPSPETKNDTQGMTSICGPCSPCGEITVSQPESRGFGGCDPRMTSNLQNTGMGNFGNSNACGSPYNQQMQGNDACGPCSPCATLFGGPSNQAQDACGPCAPCGAPFGNTNQPQSQGQDSCGPCAPCGSPFGNPSNPPGQGQDSCGPCAPCGGSSANDYAAQNQTMEGCGPCAPCGGSSSYGNQTSTMDSSCCPSGNPYGGQMPQSEACGPCAPCGDPYGGQMANMGGYGAYPPYSQGMQYGGMEPCPPCAPPGQSNQMNQMIFNQPCKPGPPPQSNLFYKVTACPEECTAAAGGVCKKAIKIEPQIGAQRLNELPEDLGRDVFVLRIGKQGDSPDHKSNLELELRTPKRPPPPSEIKETQYSTADAAEKGKKGKGKKDKGGKGKGKKGKKKK